MHTAPSGGFAKLLSHLQPWLQPPDAERLVRHLQQYPKIAEIVRDAADRATNGDDLLEELSVIARQHQEDGDSGLAEFLLRLREAKGHAATHAHFEAGSITETFKSPSTANTPTSGVGFPTSALPRAFGRYRIEKKLGEGGMGAVYLATDTALERPVALKIPLLHRAENMMVLERFRREARAVAALEHPNICGIYDVGEHDGQPYMAMAYVRGRPLSERMASYDALPVDDVLAFVEKLARALQYAHE